MKRMLLLCMLPAIMLCPLPGFARDGLSVSFGAAYNTDGANMNDFIERQGVDSNNETLAMYAKSILQQVIVPQKQLRRWSQQDHPDGNVGIPITDLEVDGGMKGINIGAYLRYDFSKKFFVRSGLEYEVRLHGGSSSWKFQNIIGIISIPSSGQGPSNGTDVSQEFRYQYMMIPLTIGINLPVQFKRGYNFNVYMGGGLSYYNGGWSLDFKAPSYYIIGRVDSINEELEFATEGMGLNWVAGADVMLTKNLALFIEFNGFYMEKQYVSYSVKSYPLKEGLFGAYTNQDLELPVDLSYTLIRVGVTYKLL